MPSIVNGSRFGLNDRQNRSLDVGTSALSFSPEIIDRMISELYRAANTNLSSVQNRNSEIAARERLGGTYEAAANRGAAIGINQGLQSGVTNILSGGEQSRIDALQFLLSIVAGEQAQERSAKAEKTQTILKGVFDLLGSGAKYATTKKPPSGG